MSINVRGVILGLFLVVLAAESFSQTDSAKTNLTFDFGITRGRNINLWPVLNKFKNNEKRELQILYPVFSKTTIYAPRQKHFQFIPFAITDSSEQEIDKRYVSFYYPSVFHSRKQEFGSAKLTSFKFLELAPNISCLGISRSPGGLFVDNNLFFFIWYKKDPVQRTTRFTVFPAYWYYSDAKDTTQLFLPFYYHTKSAYSKKLNIALLFNHEKYDNGFNRRLFPVYWRSKAYFRRDTVTKTTLFPLYWSTSSNKVNNHVLFPLVYRFKNSNRQSLTVLPLFSKGHSADSLTRHFELLQLYWNVSNRDGKTVVVAPFWIHTKRYDADTVHRNILLPLYWSQRSAEKNNKTFFPLVYKREDNYQRSLTVLPFVSYGKSKNGSSSYLGITPLFWHFTKDNNTSDILFPLYWARKNQEENNKVFVPFVFSFKNQSHQSLTVLPLFSAGHSANKTTRHLEVLQLYWFFSSPKGSTNLLFPLWLNTSRYGKTDTTSQKILFPLYWGSTNRLHNKEVFFPLVYKLHNAYRQSFTVLPVFSYGKKLDSTGQYLMVTPLYWHVSNKGTKRDVLFPLYWSTTSNDENKKLLIPFVYSQQSKEYQSLTVLPLFSTGHSADGKAKHFEMLQLYWRLRYPSGKTDIVFPLWLNTTSYFLSDTVQQRLLLPVYWSLRSTHQKRDVVFPIYWRNLEFGKNDTIRNTTVFPLYWSAKNGTRNNKVLFPLVYSFRNQHYQSFTIVPLFSAGHSNNFAKQHLEILQLYWHKKDETGSSDVLLPLWWSSKKYRKDDTLSRQTLFPVYWSAKSAALNHKLMLPLVFSFKDKHYQSLTVLPFFSSGHSTDLTQKHLEVLQLYWHFASKEGRTDLLFPFWWSNSRYTGADTVKQKTLFPLYWSVRSKAENNKVFFPVVYSFKSKYYASFTLAPLFSYGQSTDSISKHVAVTPLYWHFEHKHDRMDLIFPIYWRSKVCYSSDTVLSNTLFPVYWSRTSKNENKKTVFPLFWRSRTYDRNDTMTKTTLFPIYYSENNRDIRKKVLFPVYWRSRSFLSADTINKTTFFPIYWFKQSRTESNHVLFPVVFSLKNTSYQSFTLFPLLSFGHSPLRNQRHLMVTPLAGWFTEKGQTTAFVFPVYNYKKTADETNSSMLYFLYRKQRNRDFSKTSVLWPICERFNSDSISSFRIAPIVWYKKNDSSSMFSFQPFQYSYKSNSRKTFILCWFLYKYERTPECLSSHGVLWKVYNRERYSNGDFETRFLHLVYANMKRNGKSEKSLLPFYHFVKHTNGDQSRSVCLSFYNYFKQYIPEINEYYEEERIFWFVRLRSNYAKLKSEGKGEYLKRK